MASGPTLAASLNISACRWQAMSHVGWRLSVASSAKINRPAAPLPAGPSDFTCARKSEISVDDERVTDEFSRGGAGVLLSRVMRSFSLSLQYVARRPPTVNECIATAKAACYTDSASHCKRRAKLDEIGFDYPSRRHDDLAGRIRKCRGARPLHHDLQAIRRER